MYISLHNHSTYSNALLGFSDSVNRIEDMIQYSYDIGLSGIAISEHCGISSHLDAENYYSKMKKDRDFKLILSNEVYLIEEQEDLDNRNEYYIDENEEKWKLPYTPYYHFLLTALDEIGHKQIRILTTCSWYRSYFKKGINRRPTYYSDIEKYVKENQGHLVASTACLGGLLPKKILGWMLDENKDTIEYKKEIHKFITWGINTFGRDNFYLEIQPCLPHNAEQRLVNIKLVELSKIYGLKVIPTTDSHYLKKEDRFIHETLLKSKEADRETDDFYSTTYLMSDDELRNYLRMDFNDKQIDEFFKNTNSIGDRAKDYSLKQVSDVPLIPLDKLGETEPKHLFERFYKNNPSISYYALSKDIYHRHFWKRVEEGLLNKVINNKYRTAKIEEYISRIEEECKDLILLTDALKTKMACYYSTVEKVVELIYEVDSLVGSGRGSAGAWCIAYLLDITQCDSVEVEELQFHQRHLSAGRKQELPKQNWALRVNPTKGCTIYCIK